MKYFSLLFLVSIFLSSGCDPASDCEPMVLAREGFAKGQWSWSSRVWHGECVAKLGMSQDSFSFYAYIPVNCVDVVILNVEDLPLDIGSYNVFTEDKNDKDGVYTYLTYVNYDVLNPSYGEIDPSYQNSFTITSIQGNTIKGDFNLFYKAGLS